MKTKILLLFIILPFLTQATVWRVDGATNLDADFSDLQEAVDNASAGDTIYVAPNGGASYGNVTVTTPLTIIGTGHSLTENDSTQYFGTSSRLGVIFFEPGSSGSVLKGFEFVDRVDNYTGTVSNDDLDDCSIILNDCCILVEKCRRKGGSGGIGFTARADNCIVSKCYFPDGRMDFERINLTNFPNLVGTGIQGTLFSNSVIGNFHIDGNPANGESILSLIVDRCIFFGDLLPPNPLNMRLTLNVVNTTFSNSIFLGNNTAAGAYGDGGCLWINCIDRVNLIGSGSNNQTNVDITTLFDPTFFDNDFAGPELQFSLSETSPARNAATDGGDIGIFGGPDPYVLSGMPDIPSIFQLSVDPAGDGATQSIGVNLKAKSHE